MRLIVNDNQIRQIRLTGAPTLETLDLTNNPNPIIVDMPDTIRDLRIPPGSNTTTAHLPTTSSSKSSASNSNSNSSANITDDERPSSSDMLAYKVALDAYYVIRATYQNKLNNSKKQTTTSKSKRSIKLPECVG